MAARSRRGAGSSAETHRENGKGESLGRKAIEAIKDATGASEEDIMVMLAECNNDVNETTSRLIDNPFSQVVGKKQKKKQREEERKKDGSKVIEVRRQASTGSGERRNRERGARSSIDRNGPDRGSNRAAKGAGAKAGDELQQPALEDGTVAQLEDQKPAPVLDAPPQRVAFSKAPGPPAPAAASSNSSWAPEVGAKPTARKTMADLFKQPAPAATQPQQAPVPTTSQNGQDDLSHRESATMSDLADLSLGDPAVSAPPRLPSIPMPSSSLPSHTITQDLQVQGPSPRHSSTTPGLGIGPAVVAPQRFSSTEGGQPVSAWGKPKTPSAAGVGHSLLSSSLGAAAAAAAASSGALGGAQQQQQQQQASALPMPSSSALHAQLSAADPLVASAGLIASPAPARSGFQQLPEQQKTADRVILPPQVRDVTSLGLQFGDIGFDGRKFGMSFGGGGDDSHYSGSLDHQQQQQQPQAGADHSTAQLSSTPSATPSALDVFTNAGLNNYPQSLNSSYSSYTVQQQHQQQAPAASKPAAAPAAPARLQDAATSSQPFYTAASYNAQAAAPASQAASSYSSLGTYSSQVASLPAASQPSYGYPAAAASAAQPSYQQQQQQHQQQQQQSAPAQAYQQHYKQQQQYGAQHAASAVQQAYQQPYDTQSVGSDAASSAAQSAKHASGAYDTTTSYGSYNQPSSLKDYPQQQPQQHQQQQPAAAKYAQSLPQQQQQQQPQAQVQSHLSAAHAAYSAPHASHAAAGSGGYGAAAGSGAAASMPMPSAASHAQAPQVQYGAPGMQALPAAAAQQQQQYAAAQQQAAMYAQQQQQQGHYGAYGGLAPGYGVGGAYAGFPPQHAAAAAYGGYAPQATAGYGPAQGSAGFAGAGSSYGQQPGGKYGQPGAAGGYGVQGGMYGGPQRARGAYAGGANGYEEASSTGGYGKPDKDAAGYGPHAHGAAALYGGHHQASQLHAAPAQYQGQHAGGGRDAQYGQAAGYGQGYGAGYGAGQSQGYSGGYGQYGAYGAAQNGPNSQSAGGFGKLA